MPNVLTIPRKVTGGSDLVILPRREYEKLRASLAEVQDALGKIRRGEQEYRQGKTRPVDSLVDLR